MEHAQGHHIPNEPQKFESFLALPTDPKNYGKIHEHQMRDTFSVVNLYTLPSLEIHLSIISNAIERSLPWMKASAPIGFDTYRVYCSP